MYLLLHIWKGRMQMKRLHGSHYVPQFIDLASKFCFFSFSSNFIQQPPVFRSVQVRPSPRFKGVFDLDMKHHIWKGFLCNIGSGRRGRRRKRGRDQRAQDQRNNLSTEKRMNKLGVGTKKSKAERMGWEFSSKWVFRDLTIFNINELAGA